ncbi:MAG: glycosyltransferase [Burkholderiales bacterium]|nr:glycosyltransferase [Burkholderiales bacterium]
MKPTRILIFAKAPISGFAKTRLIPALGASAAAQLAKELLLHTVTQALSAHVGSVELCVTPDHNDAIWNTLGLPAGINWSSQGEGDLGERMARATKRCLARGESALLIGTDCPSLSLGLTRYHDSLFLDMQWSVATVAQVSTQRIEKLGWTLALLETEHDIDVPEDLQHIAPLTLDLARTSMTHL